MKNKAIHSRKLRYGGVTAVLTAAIVAAVIIVNVLFSALSTRFGWYIDLTPEPIYTLSEACINVIRNGDEKFEDSSSPIDMVDSMREANRAYNEEHGLSAGDEDYRDENLMIDIIFCDDIDTVNDTASLRYIYTTAKDLEREFRDHIRVLNYNIIRNPTSVSAYKTTSESVISTTDVIVTCGTEFRVYTLRSFFAFDTAESDTPWAYNGEKKLAAGILAVTRTETPIAALPINHGEKIPQSLVGTLNDAGYMVMPLDFSVDELPENCRLVVLYDPETDFTVSGDVDEVAKLDSFLDGDSSLMVFVDADTPYMPELEGYLEEWGIKFDRHANGNYMLGDTSQALESNGLTFKGQYVDYGLGATMTESLRNNAIPSPAIFSRAMSISHSDRYDLIHYVDAENSGIEFDFATYESNGVYRNMYDVFVSSENAVAYAGGAVVEEASKNQPFRLMTVSKEERTTQESNYDLLEEASYVIACGSTAFASDDYLENNSFGNGDVLLSVGRMVGQEPVPTGLDLIPFSDDTIDTITTAQMTRYTVILSVVPAVLAIVAGTVILIRRKYR